MKTLPLITTLLMMPFFFFFSCVEGEKEHAGDRLEDPEEMHEELNEYSADNDTTFGGRIGAAHGMGTWKQQEVLKSDIIVNFGGNEVLNGTMWVHTQNGKSRIELADGTVAVFDGNNAWISPKEAELQRARFHLLTWPYFLAAPMKMTDPGTSMEEMPMMTMGDQQFETRKLTFDPGTGDTPDDWYVLYKDPNTDQLKAMAYIVTYGSTEEQASQSPHAIVYESYEDVNGAVLSSSWKFYNWSEEEGIKGEPIGNATVTNMEFVQAPQGAFDKPENAREDEMPKASETES